MTDEKVLTGKFANLYTVIASSKVKKPAVKKPESEDVYNKNIIELPIDKQCEEYSKIFAANVNILRQIPWLASGLKINETRILYNLYLMKAFPTSTRPVKCKTLIGNTTNYHPHGDGSIESSIANMSQPWKVNCPLIAMTGNKGNASGGGQAAPRYLDCRMSEYAFDCFFKDYDDAVIDFKPSYTGEFEEPEYVLPARFPHLLLNNSYSIAQGVASAIYPCNFNEVMNLTIRLISNPELPLSECVLYPDSPTGCDIVDDGNFPYICMEGEGSYTMQGRCEIDEKRNEIHIYSTPLFTNVNKIMDQLIKLKEDKILDITGFRTESRKDTEVHRIVELKKGIDPYKALQIIFRKTHLRLSKHVSMKFIDGYNMVDHNMKTLLLDWLDFRRDYIRRIKNHELNNKREKMHLLEAILIIYNDKNYDKTVGYIKKAPNKQAIVDYLMNQFKVTSIQADKISEMSLHRFSKESQAKYRDEVAVLKKEIPALEELIRDKSKIDNEIIEQLKEGINKFGTPRKSRIIKIGKNDKLIKDSKHQIVLTEENYIKKLSEEASRAGKIGALKDGDIPIDIINVNNSDVLVIFDIFGNVSKISVSDIPVNDSKSYGHKIHALVEGMYDDIISIKAFKSESEIKASKDEVLFVTQNGLAKRIKVKDLTTVRKTVKCISIKDGDKLQVVKIIKEPTDLLIYSSDGYGVRVRSEDVREASKTAMGSIVYRLKDDSKVIGCEEISSKDKGMMIITSKGNAKLCELTNFPLSDNGNPLILIKLNKAEYIEVIKCVKGKEQFSLFMRSGVFNISVEDLGKPMPRLAKGVKTVPIRKGDKIVKIM